MSNLVRKLGGGRALAAAAVDVDAFGVLGTLAGDVALLPTHKAACKSKLARPRPGRQSLRGAVPHAVVARAALVAHGALGARALLLVLRNDSNSK